MTQLTKTISPLRQRMINDMNLPKLQIRYSCGDEAFRVP
jgi:hypothetical protein